MNKKKNEILTQLLKEYLSTNKLIITKEAFSSYVYIKNNIKSAEQNDYYLEQFLDAGKNSVIFSDLYPFLKFLASKNQKQLVLPLLLSKKSKYETDESVLSGLSFNKQLALDYICNKRIINSITSYTLIHALNLFEAKTDKFTIISHYLETKQFKEKLELQVSLWNYLKKNNLKTQDYQKYFTLISFDDVDFVSYKNCSALVIEINKSILASKIETSVNKVITSITYSLDKIDFVENYKCIIENLAEPNFKITLIGSGDSMDFLNFYVNATINTYIELSNKNDNHYTIDLSKNGEFYENQKSQYEKQILGQQLSAENVVKNKTLKI